MFCVSAAPDNPYACRGLFWENVATIEPVTEANTEKTMLNCGEAAWTVWAPTALRFTITSAFPWLPPFSTAVVLSPETLSPSITGRRFKVSADRAVRVELLVGQVGSPEPVLPVIASVEVRWRTASCPRLTALARRAEKDLLAGVIVDLQSRIMRYEERIRAL